MALPATLTLSQPEHWFELIVESLPNAILVVDQNRRVVHANPSAAVLFGYPQSDLTGQLVETLVPERFRELHPDYVQTFVSAPKARAMGADRYLYGLRKDGTEVPIEIGLNPIHTPKGLLIVASIIDITERRRADAVRQQMVALVESAEDAIISKSLDGVIRSWNFGAERLLGYRAQEIIGQSVMQLIPADRRDEGSMILDKISRGEHVAHFETLRRRKDGSLVDVALTISPIRDNFGTVIGASKIMRDITDRKRHAEELRRSHAELRQINEDLDGFVYTASHDLRAPLSGVAAVAQWILDDDGSLNEKSRQRVILIRSRIERMKKLLNDIRDFAYAGRFSVDSGPGISASVLLAEVTMTAHVPPGFTICADASLGEAVVFRMPMEQILHNLISNAIKHHDRSTGIVTISVGFNGPWYRFSIIDDGPGVPEQYRETVFEMFATLKPRDEVEGSGMGLALVRRLVERMGGHCGIEARSGRGTHVWFDWPKSGKPIKL
jgi:PAS domain S-box-containing protein